MVVLAVVLLFVGAALLIVEAFIPGFGFFGIGGVVSILISAVITAATIPYGIFIVALGILAIAVKFYFLIKYVKKRQLYGKLILDETLNSEESEIGGLEYFLGKEGVTKTPLRPVGSVDFNGTLMEVCSDGKFIKADVSVKVIEVTRRKIIVAEINKN